MTLDHETSRGLLASASHPFDDHSRPIAIISRYTNRPVSTRFLRVCAVLDPASGILQPQIGTAPRTFPGNFEYSTVSGDGCEGALWFQYGEGVDRPVWRPLFLGKQGPDRKTLRRRLILPVPVKRGARFQAFRAIREASRGNGEGRHRF